MTQNAILISDYDFEFPKELIASRAAPKGESEILLVPKSGTNLDFKKISAKTMIDQFNPGDCLVVNNTKVIPARLFGTKSTGGKFEILLVAPVPHVEGVVWEAWIKPGKHFKLGASHEVNGIRLEVIEIQEDGTRVLKFDCTHVVFDAMLDASGKIPLPPYIEREADQEDAASYQTVFAKHRGAVAAPTASLHFSEDMMKGIQAKGVHVAEVTLHVGPGTFKPVEVENALEHPMHGEVYQLDTFNAQIINDAKAGGGRIISVGTTSTRVLETVAQDDGLVIAGQGVTHAYIYPGYQWKIVDGMVTNFHWPRSTLLLLVSALCSREQILKAYNYAFEEKMRLFSYGDGMLIL